MTIGGAVDAVRHMGAAKKAPFWVGPPESEISQEKASTAPQIAHSYWSKYACLQLPTRNKYRKHRAILHFMLAMITVKNNRKIHILLRARRWAQICANAIGFSGAGKT